MPAEAQERVFKRTGSQYAPMVKLEGVGETIEGTFLFSSEGEKKGGKKFPILNLKNLHGQEIAMPMGGHLKYLVDEAGLQPGDFIRVTFIGWDEMEDGNKCRKFLLEKADNA